MKHTELSLEKKKISCSQFFTSYTGNYNTRGHCYKLATTRSGLEARKNFFSQRVLYHYYLTMQSPSLPGTFTELLDYKWTLKSSPNNYKFKYLVWKYSITSIFVYFNNE